MRDPKTIKARGGGFGSYPEPARLAAIRNQKVLYELHGWEDDDFRRRSREVYTSERDVHPACGPQPLLLDVPAGCNELASIAKDLGRCQRLTGSHVNAELQSRELISCIAVLEKLVALGDGKESQCGLAKRRELAEGVARELLNNQFAPQPNTQPREPKLFETARQLYLIDRWYRAAAGHSALSKEASEVLDLKLDEVLQTFWRKVDTSQRVFDDLKAATQAPPEQIKKLLEGVNTKRAEIEANVLRSALKKMSKVPVDEIALDALPIGGTPLLALLGDTLTPLATMLEDLSRLQDFACSFRDCRKLPSPPLPALGWHVLMSLDAPDAYRDVVNSAVPPMSSLGPAGDALRDSADTIGAISSAFERATGKKKQVFELASTAFPRPTQRLANLIRTARARYLAFSSVGHYESASSNVLNAGLDVQKKNELQALVTQRQAKVDAKIQNYRAGVLSAVKELIAAMEATKAESTLATQRLEKAMHHDDLLSDWNGLARAIEADDARFSDIVSSFATIESSIGDGAQIELAAGDIPTLQLSAANAKSGASIPEQAAEVVRGVKGGTLLQIETAGSWSPVCALQQHKLGSRKDGSPVGIVLKEALIGPQGFQVQYSPSIVDSDYTAGSKVDSGNVGVGASACVGVPLLATAVFGVSASACTQMGYQHQWSGSSGDQQSAEQRTSAAFASGIRIPDTPFPWLPSGALVVAVLSQGDLREAFVPHSPSTSRMVATDSDVYFVVNDKVCPGADGSNRLTLKVRQLRPAKEAAKAAVQAMKAILSDIRAKEATLLDQGRVLPSQAAQIRADAELRLQQAMNATSISALPTPVRILFDAFMNNEVLRLERRTEMRGLDREMANLRLWQQEVEDQLWVSGAQARLQWLLPGWTLRSLEAESMRSEASELTRVVTQYLIPVLRLWYREVLEDPKVLDAANKLLFLGPDVSEIERLQKISDVIGRMLTQLENAQLAGKPQGADLPLKAISFPRPTKDGDPYDDVFGEFRSGWRTADAARAKLVWDAITSKGVAPITITPSDLYSRDNDKDGSLSCWESSPAIKAMMLYVSRNESDSSALNMKERRLGADASINQVFASDKGEELFILENAVWQHLEVKLRYGTSGEAFTVFRASPKDDRLVGLSPFGTFNVNFKQSWADSGFDTAKELVVVVELQSKSEGQPLEWIPTCTAHP